MFREGMRLLIEKEGIGEVIAQAGNGKEFLDLLETCHPDVVLMDISMPVMNGLDATRAAMRNHPDLKILVLTVSEGPERCAEMINAGAVGYLTKTSGKQALIQAIETVATGKHFMPCREA